jgi:hypothetical protein
MMSPDRADTSSKYSPIACLSFVSMPLFLRVELFSGAIEGFLRWLAPARPGV